MAEELSRKEGEEAQEEGRGQPDVEEGPIQHWDPVYQVLPVVEQEEEQGWERLDKQAHDCVRAWLVGHLEVHLDDHIAVDNSAQNPKGRGVAKGVDIPVFKAVCDHKYHKQSLKDSLNDVAPEGAPIKEQVQLANILVVKLGRSQELFPGKLKVENGEPDDGQAGEEEVVDLVLPLLVEGLPREAVEYSEPELRHHHQHILEEHVAD